MTVSTQIILHYGLTCGNAQQGFKERLGRDHYFSGGGGGYEKY